jgi:hypothetical protein
MDWGKEESGRTAINGKKTRSHFPPFLVGTLHVHQTWSICGGKWGVRRGGRERRLLKS